MKEYHHQASPGVAKALKEKGPIERDTATKGPKTDAQLIRWLPRHFRHGVIKKTTC